MRVAAMRMVSPVRGLRPSRAGRAFVTKMPSPAIETSSPSLESLVDRLDDRLDGALRVGLGRAEDFLHLACDIVLVHSAYKLVTKEV